MKMVESKKYRLSCDCGCHEIGISADWDSYNGKVMCDFLLSFWQIGHSPFKWVWLDRFKMAWQILTQGHCYTDMVTLNFQERRKFYEIMKEVIEIDEKLESVNSHENDN